jgi:hypothetical protein
MGLEKMQASHNCLVLTHLVFCLVEEADAHVDRCLSSVIDWRMYISMQLSLSLACFTKSVTKGRLVDKVELVE